MDLMLAGLVLPDVENHSLARLAAAVEAAGHGADVVPFRGFTDIDGIAERVRRAPPRIFGLSIQTTEAALASVMLIEVLRRRGYAGLVVAGGHFATLNAEELLAEVDGIDAVVRFAGEPALAALLASDWRGGPAPPPADVPGLVYRGDGGRILSGGAPLIDPPAGARAAIARGAGAGGADGGLPLHLGFRAADIVASRGCDAHCSYCCVAGASDLAARSGGPRYHRRGADALADEMAALHHEREARVFNFMDDNLLPLDPAAARGFVAELAAALTARRVGRIAFSLQLRADVCTPDVVAALADLGLVRGYVGIDGYSARQLVALGRDAPAAAGPVALDRLHAAGVFSVCNALIIGPTFSYESITREIEALCAVRHAPVHLLPIDVRAGSAYFERVRSKGLLEGGLLWRRYRFADARTALLAEAVTSFPTRLDEYSVPIALYDLGYNLGIARRLCPGADTAAVAAIAATYARVTAAWNADQVRILRAAAAAADAGGDAVRDLVARESGPVQALDDELRADAAEALRAVERVVARARGGEARAHARGQLLSAVALSMALAACGRRAPLRGADGAATDAADASSAAPDGAGRDAIVIIPLPDAAPDGDGPFPCGVPDRTPFSTPPVDPGLSFCCGGPNGGVEVTFDAQGIPTIVNITVEDGGTVDPGLRTCLERTLARYCYPSLANSTQQLSHTHCWVA